MAPHQVMILVEPFATSQPDSQRDYSAVTDSEGRYWAQYLPAGNYRLRVIAKGPKQGFALYAKAAGDQPEVVFVQAGLHYEGFDFQMPVPPRAVKVPVTFEILDPKMPGQAWIEFVYQTDKGKSTLRTDAFFFSKDTEGRRYAELPLGYRVEVYGIQYEARNPGRFGEPKIQGTTVRQTLEVAEGMRLVF